MSDDEGWRVVRILRIAVDDAVYPTAEAGMLAINEWVAQYPEQAFALVPHTAIPDGFIPNPDE